MGKMLYYDSCNFIVSLHVFYYSVLTCTLCFLRCHTCVCVIDLKNYYLI